jgi:uncharacterized membrane protein YqgA involved in biofilm formation
MIIIGPILNVAGILVGGAVGLVRRRPLSRANEGFSKITLAAFTVFYGLRLTYLSLNGPYLLVLKQIFILIVSLIVGRLLGRLLRLQQFSNQLGRRARDRILAAHPNAPGRLNDGFKACTALFCAAPLGILGVVAETLSPTDYVYPLAIKAVMDGLATMGFMTLFGWGVMLSALPVLAFQSTVALLCSQGLEPFLSTRQLVDPINAVCGILIFCVALIMLEIKRVELADYLPSLAVAPLLTLLLR